MRCPFCGHLDTSVKDSRGAEEDAVIRRRRYCTQCNARFTTVERVQLLPLNVVKKNGEIIAFERDKLARSVYLALHKRPIEHEHVERMINSLVRQFETLGETEIQSHTIGEMVMSALQDLDTVAYVRFASVYHQFNRGKDFEAFVAELKGENGDKKQNDSDIAQDTEHNCEKSTKL
jgi:transcriptional repressor NrdR